MKTIRLLERDGTWIGTYSIREFEKAPELIILNLREFFVFCRVQDDVAEYRRAIRTSVTDNYGPY